MAIRRSHVDLAFNRDVAMGRLHGWKRSPFGEKLRKAALVRSDLQDHEDSSRQVRKKSGDQRSKGFHASGGSSDHDDVLGRHWFLRSTADVKGGPGGARYWQPRREIGRASCR